MNNTNETLNIDDILKELDEAEKRSLEPNQVDIVEERLERGLVRSIKEFVQELEIQAGEDRVPNYLIYQSYLGFKPHMPKESKIEFFRQFGRVFKLKRLTNVRTYMLNSESFDMSIESITYAKEKDREMFGKKKEV